MADTPYPLPRQQRESAILVGNGTVGPYGPSTYKVFDTADVGVFVRLTGEPGFTDVTDSVTVAKTADAQFDTFSVTFDDPLPNTASWYHQSDRLHERQLAITRGGALSADQLEKELSKQGSVLQEIFRNLRRTLRVAPGQADPGSVIPEANKVVGFGSDLKIRMFVNTAAEAEDAAERAQAAAAAALVTKGEVEAIAEAVEGAQEDTLENRLLAEQARDQAIEAKEDAEFAAQAALAAGRIFLTIVDGLAGTPDGEFFFVLEEDAVTGFPIAQLYQDVAGVEDKQDFRLASQQFYDALAALIGPLDDPTRLWEAQDKYGYIVAYMGADGRLVSFNAFAILPSDQAFEVQDSNGHVLARFDVDGSVSFAGTKLRISSDPLEIQDIYGHTLFRVGGDGSMNAAGLSLRVSDRPFEVQDINGYTLARFEQDGSAMVGGLVIDPRPTNGNLEFASHEGYVTVRIGAKQSMLHGIYVESWPPGTFEIHDIYGYILWRPGMVSGTTPEPATGLPQPTDRQLYFGRYIYGVEDEDTVIFINNLFANRNDGSLCEGSILPRAGRPQSFSKSIRLVPSDMGGGGKLIVRPHTWDGENAAELRFTTRVASAASVDALNVNITAITDSVATYQGIYYLNKWLVTEWGATVAWGGTLPSENNTPSGVTNHFVLDDTLAGECRPGIEIADYTYLLTNSVDPVPIGGEAAYLADTTSNRRTFNPLIVPDDDPTWGPFDPEDIHNNHAISFDAYFSRFSVAVAHMLYLFCGRNDVRAQANNVTNTYNRFYNEVGFIWRAWRRHSLTKPFVFMMSSTARSPEEDEDWVGEIAAFRALLKLQADLADPNFHICFVHAFVPSDGGFDLTNASTSPDATTGVIPRTTEDGIHPGPGIVREESFRQAAMTGAYALTHVV